MTKVLSQAQVEAYDRDGFVFPVRIMDRTGAADLLARFEGLERRLGAEPQQRFKIKAHMPLPWLNALVRNPVMLDAVEDLIGPNILCWGSSFFTKKAHDRRFVSWHQDSTYYGLRPAETVTPWVAFTDSRIDSGCVRFLPGTHKGGILDHAETGDAENLLMKGQTITGVDDSQAVDCELSAGEISIHHESVVHGSNTSDGPRIGLSIHYIAPHVRQTAFEGATAMLVRGRDTHGHWAPEPEPAVDDPLHRPACSPDRFRGRDRDAGSRPRHSRPLGLDPACLAALDEVYGQYRSGIGKRG